MRNCINMEFRYLIKSKVLWLLFISLVMVSTGIIYYNCKWVIDTDSSYDRLVEYYEKNNVVVEDEMDDSYGMFGTGEYAEDGSEYVEINNPLRYYYETFKKQYYVVSSSYVVDQYLEYGLMAFPIVFSIFGIIMATYDKKYKITKTKTVRFGKNRIFFAKQIVMLGVTIMMIFVTSVLNYLLAYILRKLLLKNIDLTKYGEIEFDSSKNLVIKLLFAVVISIVFIQFGYLLGKILENTLLGTIITFVYVMFFPNITNFSLKNVIYVLADRIFDFSGSFTVEKIYNINILLAIITLFTYCLVMNFCSYIVNKKKSAFS